MSRGPEEWVGPGRPTLPAPLNTVRSFRVHRHCSIWRQTQSLQLTYTDGVRVAPALQQFLAGSLARGAMRQQRLWKEYLLDYWTGRSFVTLLLTRSNRHSSGCKANGVSTFCPVNTSSARDTWPFVTSETVNGTLR
jgi:hypothetical protein